MFHVVLKQLWHIKRPLDDEALTYFILQKSPQALRYLLSRLGFIIRSHPEDTWEGTYGIPLGPVAFLIQSQPVVHSSL